MLLSLVKYYYLFGLNTHVRHSCLCRLEESVSLSSRSTWVMTWVLTGNWCLRSYTSVN